MPSEFASIPFQDRVKAEGNIARLERQLAPSLMTPLASLLLRSPDPDGALNLLERYAEAASPEVLSGLARHPVALTYLVAIFGYSAFLAESFLAEMDLPIQFARDKNFTKLKTKEDLMQDFARFASTSPEPWLAAQLARFKRRHYLRIVLKDVLGISTLGETTLELSALADVILANALVFCDQELERRYGQPQYRDTNGRIARSRFSIISLGKLGGNELNYSSDVDLLFLYSHDGETAGSTERDSIITNKEYFVRLAHAVTRTVTQTTPQGQPFRVDLRLRPEGEQGDLAISLSSALEYYERRARDWELQMLIKARHSAGDARLTRHFLHDVGKHVYGQRVDFTAIESVLQTRERMSKKLRGSHADVIDVKRHRGGIRDIEFLVQCLQRLHGGHDPWVRSGGTLLALRKLNDKGWLSDSDCATLSNTYEFLRGVEHRIQFERGQQTHRLPSEPDALDRLARRVNVEPRAGERPGQALSRRLQEGFAAVNQIYTRTIYAAEAVVAGKAFDLRPVPTPVGESALLSYDAIRALLEVQAPDLARLLRQILPSRPSSHVVQLLTAFLSTSEAFSAARQSPEAFSRAVELARLSHYFAELLSHHPEQIITLSMLGFDAQAELNSKQMEIGLEERSDPQPFPGLCGTSLPIVERMALLRRHYRSGIVESGAGDVLAFGSIFSALGRWSSLAVRAVVSAVGMAWECFQSPSVPSLPEPDDMPFAVLGLGRLGLNEFDLASDADLVFVVGSTTSREERAFWTRLAEKTIDVLASYTRDGALFAVDTRLRPRGQEGELIITDDALLDYFAHSAQVWEALTYLKVRPVGGNFSLGRSVVSRLLTVLLDRFGTYDGLEHEIRQMRGRLEKEVTISATNTKTAPGGYYDVDFAVSLLRLRNHVNISPGTNIAERIARLRSAGAISAEDARSLTEGAAFLRSVDHAIRLVTGRAPAGLPERPAQLEAVTTVLRRWGLLAPAEMLANRLRETQQQIRSIYRRLVGSE